MSKFCREKAGCKMLDKRHHRYTRRLIFYWLIESLENPKIPRHYPSLPKPVYAISTVTWGNKIIVMCGLDKTGQTLNDVIMYDTETGRSERLPALNHKRSGHSAVIMHDVIVVSGDGMISRNISIR